MFPPPKPIVRDMAWIEEHLGPIASVEVLLNFDASDTMDHFERAMSVNRVVKQLRSDPDVGGVMSALTFLPPMPTSGQMRDVIKRSAMRKLLEKNASTLAESGWIGEMREGQAWRSQQKCRQSLMKTMACWLIAIRSAVEKVELREGETKHRSPWSTRVCLQ